MKASFRKILFKIHLYGGLLFFPYLLIFGISSLNVNHHFSFFEQKQEWSEPITYQLDVPDIKDDQELALAIRDSLDLVGWCPWWERARSETNYDFWVSNFGNEHRLNYDFNTSEITLKTRYKGLANIFNALHFLGESVPNGGFIINSWQYYQDLTVFYILLAAIIGIILFLKRKRERKIGLAMLIGSFSFSLLLMIYVWLIG